MEMTRARDNELVVQLHEVLYVLMPELGAPKEIVAQAVSTIRDRAILAEDPAEEGQADGEDYPDLHDWLVPRVDDDAGEGESKGRREQANDAAGDILEEVLRLCGYKGPASTSRGSTSEYATRFDAARLAMNALEVSECQSLTLLATLFGVPLRDAPWVAFRFRLLLQGKDLEDIAREEWVDNPELPPPTEYRLPKIQEWRRIRDSVRGRLVEAGRPEGPATEVEAARLTAIHLRRFVRKFAGRSIPKGQRTTWAHDQFDPEHFPDVRQALKPSQEGGGSATWDELVEGLAGIIGDDLSLATIATPEVMRGAIEEFCETLSLLDEHGLATAPRFKRRGKRRSRKK